MSADDQREQRALDLDAQMGLAIRAQAAHVAASHHIDRRGWTQEQWVEDARRLMNDPDGSVLALLNGHAMALIAAARERDRLQGLVASYRSAAADYADASDRADEAEAERDQLRATVERVRALHMGEPIEGSAVGPAWCSECGGGSPCSTLLALGDQR